MTHLEMSLAFVLFCKKYDGYNVGDIPNIRHLCIIEHINLEKIFIVDDSFGIDILHGNQYNISYKIFEANWKEFGKAAGPIRNEQMAKYGTHLLAFWDLKSKGTKNMILNAKQNNLHIKVVQI